MSSVGSPHDVPLSPEPMGLAKLTERLRRFDVLDANYYHTSPRMGRLCPDSPSRGGGNGIVRSIARFVRGVLQGEGARESVSLFRNPAGENVSRQGGHLFFAENLNEWNAIEPVVSQIDDAVVVYVDPSLASKISVCEALAFPRRTAHVLALPWLPFVISHWLHASDYERLAFRYGLDRLWLSYGVYLVWKQLIKRFRPRTLTVSNDHNMTSRVGLMAASEEGVATAYVQHAAALDTFPPLSVDVAFLDGSDALAKYEQAGPSSSKVFLVGCARFDALLNSRNTIGANGRGVGLCINSLDDLADSLRLIEYLAEHSAKRVVVRPHPRTPAGHHGAGSG